MELRSRPFAYAETSQLDLDSLLLYTTSIVVDVSDHVLSGFSKCCLLLYDAYKQYCTFCYVCMSITILLFTYSA